MHTLIATFGGHPYVTFSSNDRRVMFLWRGTWQIEDVCCVLYSEQEAHCEAEVGNSGEAPYAYPRGNRILR